MTQYVIVKTPGNSTFSFSRLKDTLIRKMYSNPFQFVWNMAAYHALILFSLFVLGFNPPAKVALPLGQHPVEGVQLGNETYLATLTWESAIFFAIILILDFWFLSIIKSELKPKIWDMDKYGNPKKEWLTYKKILVIEAFLLVAGIFSPTIRAGMLFFGANTIQIAVVKKWVIVQWRPSRFQFGEPAKWFFITGSYGLILILIWDIIVWGFFT